MTYYDHEQLSDDEMASINAAVAGYDEEVRSMMAMEADMEALRRDGVASKFAVFV